MHEIARSIMEAAEKFAKDGDLLKTIDVLRRLSLDDFGEVMFSLPMADFPAISALLPRMAASDVQRTWTGAIGMDLLKPSLGFMRQLEAIYARTKGRSLLGQSVLDFGCGYGRFLRLLSYYTNPDNIWGVDAWESSLRHSRECGVLAQLRKSDVTPTTLPVDGHQFDLAFAFSVFTHLSPQTATAALSAIRQAMREGGIFVATTRPVEYWRYKDRVEGSDMAPRLEKIHRENGFAYVPDKNDPASNYGAFSAKLEWFAQDGWKLEGYDSNVFDTGQISVVLRAI